MDRQRKWFVGQIVGPFFDLQELYVLNSLKCLDQKVAEELFKEKQMGVHYQVIGPMNNLKGTP